MSDLSSHSLFHFTHRLEILKAIIENGFRYSIIGESLPDKRKIYLVESVSFCNIPLSSISEHASWYGSYGIGVTPTYAKTIGATPVIYCHKDTPILKSTKGIPDDTILPYLKRNCGKQQRYHCSKMENKDFYDEKEWRCVIPPASIHDCPNLSELRQIVKDANVKRKKDHYYTQRLNPSDINYIILNYTNEIIPFRAWLSNISDFSNETLPTIISCEQLYKDF